MAENREKAVRNPAKEYLRMLRGIEHELAELRRGLADARENQDTVPGPSWDGARLVEVRKETIMSENGILIPHGPIVASGPSSQKHVTKSDPTADKATAVVDIEDQIAMAETRARRLRAEAEALLDCLDSTERRVLRFYYFHAMSWPEVAGAMHFSERKIHTIHSELLGKLNRNHFGMG